MSQGLLVALAAVIAAAVSSGINGLFNKKLKERELVFQEKIKGIELETQRVGMALKFAELKHQQLVLVTGWDREDAKKEGKAPTPVDLWDPLDSAIEYLKGWDEFKRTGRWKKAETDRKKRGVS